MTIQGGKLEKAMKAIIYRFGLRMKLGEKRVVKIYGIEYVITKIK